MTYYYEKKNGVVFYKATGKYGAHIYCLKKDFYLGTFETSEEAFAKRKEAEKIYHAFSMEFCDNYEMTMSERVEELKKRLNIKDGRLVLNKKISVNNKSGCSGVYEIKWRNRWQAYISWHGKRIHLGYFATKQEAAVARKKAEKSYAEMNGNKS